MDQPLDRRTFVGAAAAAGVLTLAGDPLRAAEAAGRRLKGGGIERARDVTFKQGVASGDPTAHRATLWTRVDGLERDARVTLEVARDRGFDRVVERREVVARKRDNYSVKQRVSGLDPGEQYYYRFFTGKRDSDVGRFRSAVPADSNQPVRVGIFSCQDYESGFYPGHRAMANDDLDVVVCLGDYIYERSYEKSKVRVDGTGRNGDGEVQSLAEYRDKYALYHGDRELRALRANHALMAIWDDHEVEDNWAGDRAGDKAIDPRIAFLKRRRNGFRAFFEHMPRMQNPRERFRIYDTLRFGRNLELFLLDERQYRSDQPCGDQIIVPCPPAERNDPRRTLLGKEQMSWLKRTLRESDAVWKAVANQVMIMSVDFPLGSPINPDQWDGYGADRTELLSHIRDQRISDVAFLTGDIHTFFAGDVTPTGRQGPAQTGPPPVATEFVCGSVTSQGLLDNVGLSGQPDLGSLIVDGAVAPPDNPHFRYSNVKDKGYAVVEASRDELKVSFRSPASVKSRNSPVRSLKDFTVRRGIPRVEIT